MRFGPLIIERLYWLVLCGRCQALSSLAENHSSLFDEFDDRARKRIAIFTVALDDLIEQRKRPRFVSSLHITLSLVRTIIRELHINAEVVLFQHRDYLLKRVSILA